MSKKRKKLPEGEFEADIESLSHGGRGIAKLNGKVTFIDNALPGETVKFKYLKTQKQWDEGQATEIINSSPERTEPVCPHYAQCGGCSLQHLKSQSQLKLKQDTLLEQLHHFAGLEPQAILDPITGPTEHYRTKARLGARYVHKKASVLVGFREKFSHFVTDMQQCPILNSQVDKAIPALRQMLSELSVYNAVPQIEVAASDNATALIIRHLEALTDQDYALLRSFADKHDMLIYLQPKGPDTIHLLDDQYDRWLNYQLKAYDLTFYFYPTDFTQVNQTINAKLVQLAINKLDLQPTDEVLDLFCGLGNFSLPIAQYAHSVTGIEGSEAMVNRATMNAKANQITNTAFYQADLTQIINTHPNWLKHYDKLLLDPPRSGAAEIVESINKLDVSKIIYVSCNPATLARDSYTLKQQGYQLKEAGILDMFPHTSHVESIAVFEK